MMNFKKMKKSVDKEIGNLYNIDNNSELRIIFLKRKRR